MRSILATSGLVLLSLIGIDFYMKETDKSSSKTITDYQNEENNKLSRTSTTTGPFTVSTISGRTSDVPVIFGKEKIKLVLIGILLKMDQSMMTIINNCPVAKIILEEVTFEGLDMEIFSSKCVLVCLFYIVVILL